MDHRGRIARYARWYSRLLWLFPVKHRQRFGDEMEQLFRDRLWDRANDGEPLWSHALWMSGETLLEVVREIPNAMMAGTKSPAKVALVTVAMLMVPFVAMQATGEVNWTPFDFMLAGTTLFLTGLAFQFMIGRSRNGLYRVAVALAIGAALLLFWMNGAVGLIGSEADDFNTLYHSIPVVGVVGAFTVRFRPAGMAWVLGAMALVHAALGLAALALQKHDGSVGEGIEILGVTGLFVMLFLGAGWLFRKAGPSADLSV